MDGGVVIGKKKEKKKKLIGRDENKDTSPGVIFVLNPIILTQQYNFKRLLYQM